MGIRSGVRRRWSLPGSVSYARAGRSPATGEARPWDHRERAIDEEGDAMTRLDTLEDRYQNDPAFRHVVDSLQAIILGLELSPGEVREAAMFAAFRVELYHPRPLYIRLREDAEVMGQLATIARRRNGGDDGIG